VFLVFVYLFIFWGRSVLAGSLAFIKIVRFGFRGFLENRISFGFGSRDHFKKLKNLSISRPGQLFLTNGFGLKEYFQKLKHVGSRARSISFTNGFGFFKYFQKLKTCWLCGWVKLF